LIAKELFNPNFGLFRLAANKRSLEPNPDSRMILNHLVFFEFAGIALAKVFYNE